jgi:hypothetical protein
MGKQQTLLFTLMVMGTWSLRSPALAGWVGWSVIAGCLMVLMFHSVSLMPGARAAASTTCTGEMKATSAGPMQASMGSSYKIEVTCN